MGPVSAIVLYCVIWVLTFLCILPIRIRTQGDLGEIVPGTHAGSPEHHHLRPKIWIATGVAFVLWAIVATIIITGYVTLDDIDLFRRYGPGSGGV